MFNRIGVIGTGFVGNAVVEGMRHAFDVLGYDKLLGFSYTGKDYLNLENNSNLTNCEILLREVSGPIFVCVPTPMKPDGSCDTSIVEEVVKSIDEVAVQLDVYRIIVIKSTVTPGTTERLNEETSSNVDVCFNPEFLTERHSVQDFKNQDRIILGGPHRATSELRLLYQTAYPDVPTTKTHSTIAEMVKYTTNCFLATKVAFANEIYQICSALDIDYDKVIEYATKDKRLGLSHWSVPGPDGHVGFGGKCFCKDLNGLMSLMRNCGVKHSTMAGAWDTNLHVRPSRDWEDIKGVISE